MGATQVTSIGEKGPYSLSYAENKVQTKLIEVMKNMGARELREILCDIAEEQFSVGFLQHLTSVQFKIVSQFAFIHWERLMDVFFMNENNEHITVINQQSQVFDEQMRKDIDNIKHKRKKEQEILKMN